MAAVVIEESLRAELNETKDKCVPLCEGEALICLLAHKGQCGFPGIRARTEIVKGSIIIIESGQLLLYRIVCLIKATVHCFGFSNHFFDCRFK